jgi:hypothetical protein
MSFIAIFLQLKTFPVSSSDILPGAIKLLKEKDTIPLRKEFDSTAMLGHRIGMLENSSEIKQYLQNISPSLRPDGGLIFTSINISRNPDLANRPAPVYDELQIQQVNLIGPFFALLRVKAEALQKQATAANWQFEMLYRQDENNYAAQLNPCKPAL